MVFDVDKITNLELNRESCRCIIFVRPLTIEADIFLTRARDYLTASRSRRPLLSPRYLILGESNFWRGVRGSLSKRRRDFLYLGGYPEVS